MGIIQTDTNAPTSASLGGLLKVGARVIEKAKPVVQSIGQTISIGLAVEKVDRVLSDAQASADEKLTIVLNNLAARLKASPLTRTITFGELIDLTGQAGATDPIALAQLLIPQFKDP